jgi:hypothetical protein
MLTEKNSRKIRYTRPPLYAMQEAALFCPERFAVTEAGTKSGKTVGCLCWLLEQAIAGKRGQNYWWVAPSTLQARIAFTRMKDGLPKDLYHTNDTLQTLALPNGTTLWFRTGEKPDLLYGEDVYACVIDEASRMREAAWHAIRSTLTATRGPVRIIGNVRGRKNWAYHLARKAEAGEPDWHYAKITAWDAVKAGVLAQEEIDGARSMLPEAVFNELYLAEASDDQGNPFGIGHIRDCTGSPSTGQTCVFGWDLARSIDWTVGIGLDPEGNVSRFSRWQSPWEETHRRILDETGETPALVDCTGIGDAPFERLQRSAPNFSGYVFSQPSKQKLMETLAVAIQHREVSFPEGPITAELESFEYVYSRTGVHYSAPEGMHDDCVCALALAVTHLQSEASRELSFVIGNKPKTEEEKTQAGKEAVMDAIRTQGYFWPGGR